MAPVFCQPHSQMKGSLQLSSARGRCEGGGQPISGSEHLAGRSFDLQQSPGLISSDQVTEMVLTNQKNPRIAATILEVPTSHRTQNCPH